MSNNDIMTHSAAIEWAPAMVPVLADRALGAERLRRLPEETIADFDAADVWRLVVPERLGGHGHGLRTMTAGCPLGTSR